VIDGHVVIDAVDGYSNDDLTSVHGTKRTSAPWTATSANGGKAKIIDAEVRHSLRPVRFYAGKQLAATDARSGAKRFCHGDLPG